MKRCDLHTHSNCSDGSLSPTQLVHAAAQSGLSAVALTDHNTVLGLPEFTHAGARAQILTVPGCEFSTEYDGTELHLIGLFLPQDKWDAFDTILQKQHEQKRESNDLMLARMQADGFAVTREEAEALTDADEINRAHVARVLLEKGYVESVTQAFQTLLQPDGKYYTPPARPRTLDVIRRLRAVGAVPVLAHPFLNLDETRLRAFLPRAVEAGLCAMETHYSGFDAQTTQKASQIAAQFDLAESGGSDFHGEAKPEIRLGSGTGALCVPFAFYERLAAVADSLRG